MGMSFLITKIFSLVFSSIFYFVFNFDDKAARERKDDFLIPSLSFGFKEGADIKASDLRAERELNFKINYKGNVVPIWLKERYKEEEICGTLAAIACGIIFDMNLVEVSQALKK